MDIDQLTAFERIAREGSFSRAAWELGIAQPTISARIQALEAEVGGALFQRSGRQITLTALGSSFLPYARRALAVLSEGLEAARESSTGKRGRITFGALNSLSDAFLGPIITQFHNEFPDVELFIRSGDHERIVDLLSDGIIELGLLTWPCLDSLINGHQPLFFLSEAIIVVCAPSHPLAGVKEIGQKQLAAEAKPLLIGRWWLHVHINVLQLAQSSADVLYVPIETARTMVLAGSGVGLFTRAAVMNELNEGRLVELRVPDLPPITRESVLVRGPRSASLSPVSQTFIDSIRARAAQLNLLREDV
jgi:DNA-binding transcriptional LysR family regulator